MGNYYYVNRNETCNLGHHHEVHTQMHIQQLDIRDTLYLGFFENEIEAVATAKQHYTDADGCAICCPMAHTG